MTTGQPAGFQTVRDVDATWRDRAACRLADPDLFFPAGGTGVAVGTIEAARSVCGRCPVTSACLEFALDTKQEAGIWGGITEDERRSMRRGWLAARRRQAG